MSKTTRIIVLFFYLYLALSGLTLKTAWAMKASEPPSSWFIDLSRFALSAHGTLSCEQCHGTMKEKDRLHPNVQDTSFLKQEAGRKYDYKRCQSCHRNSYDRYLKGAHAKALQKERETPVDTKTLTEKKGQAPTCGDCHSSHYEKAHLSRLETGRQMTERCGSCHLAQKTTYLENYHGKAAVHLGKTTAAYCTDCHGAHNCLSLKDKQQALQACSRCHPQASPNFAAQVIHPILPADGKIDPEKAAKVRVIKWVTLIMGTMV
ncbi:MAG: hypothetical protein C0407_01415, partial [Desulfobacca sp.]|nr:hypothetical protein [Desulfobacca sp.]